MRIKCYSVESFLSNLIDQNVFQKTVFVNRSCVPLGNNPRDSVSFDINIQASAVIEYDDGGQALVECGEFCGVDRHTGDGDDGGTRKQIELYEALVNFCSQRDLVVKPGVLDM